jgi:hypothetical protein
MFLNRENVPILNSCFGTPLREPISPSHSFLACSQRTCFCQTMFFPWFVVSAYKCVAYCISFSRQGTFAFSYLMKSVHFLTYTDIWFRRENTDNYQCLLSTSWSGQCGKAPSQAEILSSSWNTNKGSAGIWQLCNYSWWYKHLSQAHWSLWSIRCGKLSFLRAVIDKCHLACCNGYTFMHETPCTVMILDKKQMYIL